MGHVFADIELSNPLQPGMPAVKTKSLADTSALMLCIPEYLALQLGLETQSAREVSAADGRRRKVPYVGPVQIRFDNRHCFTGALVLGDSVVLGAIPMQDLDLVINPQCTGLTVNPTSPKFPMTLLK